TTSASQLAGNIGRSGSPTTGSLTDPAASPLLAVPQPQDAVTAPQLASAPPPAPPRVLAVDPAAGNVLAAGHSTLLARPGQDHPLLRVMLPLVAIAIAALA